MYRNVINNHDVWLLTHFLQEFAEPVNPRLFFSFSYSPHAPVSVCKGIVNMVYGLTQIHLKFPDCVHLLSETAIHVPHHGVGSRIVSKMIFEGTRLYEFEDDPVGRAARAEARRRDRSHNNDNRSRSNDYDGEEEAPSVKVTACEQLLPAISFAEIQHSREPHESFSPLINNPKEMEEDLMSRFQSLQLYSIPTPRLARLEGTLTLSLTANHRIEAIHFEVSEVREAVLYLPPANS